MGDLPASPKIWTFPFCWISPPPENWVPYPYRDHRPHIIKKKILLIAFRKYLPAACIFIYEIITYLKNLLELNPLIQDSDQQDYLPKFYPTIPLSIYGKPSGWGRIPPNGRKLLISLDRKMHLDKFPSSAIKSVIPSLIKYQFSSNYLIQASFMTVVIAVVSLFF